MHVHETQVPCTSPVTRATSKPGRRYNLHVRLHSQFFRERRDATRTRAIAPVKNVIFRRPCFVIRGLQFTICTPRFTIPLEPLGLSALSLSRDGQSVLLIITAADALSLRPRGDKRACGLAQLRRYRLVSQLFRDGGIRGTLFRETRSRLRSYVATFNGPYIEMALAKLRRIQSQTH